MSEGHSTVDSSGVSTCSASTSSGISARNGADASRNDEEQPSRFCVNEIPWKLVPQTFEEEGIYEYLDENEKRISDVESFVWKWSPCGRYGIDLPGGRDMISQNLKDKMAVFDLHTNSWTLYSIDVLPSDIPRVCFIYWARNDIIVVVTLVKDYEPGPDEEVRMKFKQSFYYISHETKSLEHAGSCKYRTNKTIVASYWFHIFENRRGEPFVDHNNDLWLVFSNGKDALILLPYIPTPSCYKSKCVTFNMDEIVSGLLGTRVFLDPFISSHFVPWVHRNEINFFIRIDSFSFVEEEDRDYGEDVDEENATTQAQRGFFQLRVNLKDVIAKGENKSADGEDVKEPPNDVETRFTKSDVDLWRKVAEDNRHEHHCITQHNKQVVLLKWAHFSIDMSLSKRLGTRVADIFSRDICCSAGTRDFSFCSIDLESEKIRKFDTLILGTDVIVPHPSGSMFMFRFKEEYAMTFCELPFFEPLSLRLKCMQSLSGCVEIDPAYHTKRCILKRVDDENPVQRLSK